VANFIAPSCGRRRLFPTTRLVHTNLMRDRGYRFALYKMVGALHRTAVTRRLGFEVLIASPNYGVE